MSTVIRSARLLAVIPASVILLAGCEKISEYVHHPGNGDAEIKVCAISNITTSIGAYNVHYRFEYNKFGDPVSVTNDLVGTGNPNMLFRYDKNNRLRECLRPYTNGSYGLWSLYGYNSKKQIVYDTSYSFGTITDSIPSAESAYGVVYTMYTYDAMDRMVTERDSIIADGRFIDISYRTFEYDALGNLSTYGNIHDNKLNVRRTNKVWMFITRDYSVNNPFIASAYNEYGLPLALQATYRSLGDIAPVGGNMVIEYTCK